MVSYKLGFISDKSTSALDIATIKMESDAEIPCSTCPLWHPEEKSFSCNPNKCEKLSNWLLKHAKESASKPQDEIVQYVV